MRCGRPAPGTGQAAPGSPSAGGRPGGELADPAHPLGGRLGVAAELLCRPTRAAAGAEPAHGALIASVTLSAVGASDRCSSEANRASHRAPSTFNRAITPPLVSRLKRPTGLTLPRLVSLVKRLTFAKL